jgi:hypothetical protein
MNARPVIFVGLACTLVFLLTSCASTKTNLTNVWKDDGYTGGPLKNVMVVGLSDNFDRRKGFERVFASQFRSHGVEAISSADVIPQDMEIDKDTVKGEAERRGIDSILVTHLIGVDREYVYQPPSPKGVAPDGRFGRYYSRVRAYATDPGYYVEKKEVRLESNLYERQTEELIWTATSETIYPESVDKVIESVCRAVMRNLRDNNLIG